MNGRLYDPQLGRMLSPDPVVITNASLNFNSYSYVNNNPLKYTDPTGELAWFVIPAIMIIAGGLNVGSAALNGPISFKQGLGLFFTGALAAGVGMATGGIGGAALGGFLNSSISTGIMGGNFSQALTSGFVGALSGAVGFGAGNAVGNGIGNLALKYGVQGAVGGAAAGFTGGFVGTYFSGGDIGDMFKNGLIGAGIGAGIGGALGLAVGAVQNVRAGNNAWTGKQVTPGRSPWSFRNSKIPSDAKPKFQGESTRFINSTGKNSKTNYKIQGSAKEYMNQLEDAFDSKFETNGDIKMMITKDKAKFVWRNDAKTWKLGPTIEYTSPGYKQASVKLRFFRE